MRVFISWSGSQSREFALALRDWLRLVLQYIDPWLSDTDIGAGDRWSVEVGKQLESSNFGILCLTSENLLAPWLFFEAGALAKSISAGVVCPYLLDIDFADISGPLAQFQAKKAEEKSTFEMITAINKKAKTPVEERLLARLYGELWPAFERELSRIRKLSRPPQPRRHQADVLEDLVSSVRSLDQRLERLAEAQEVNMRRFASSFSQKVEASLLKTQQEISSVRQSQQLAQEGVGSTLRELNISIAAVKTRVHRLENGSPSNGPAGRIPQAAGNARPPEHVVLDQGMPPSAEIGRSPFWTLAVSHAPMRFGLIALAVTLASGLLLSVVWYTARYQSPQPVEKVVTSPAPSSPSPNTQESLVSISPDLIRVARQNKEFRHLEEVYGLSVLMLLHVLQKELDLHPRTLSIMAEEGDSAIRSAVAQVQREYSLKGDGRFGPETELLFLVLAFRQFPSDLDDAFRKAHFSGRSSYHQDSHFKVAARICDEKPILRKEVNAVLAGLYGREIYQCRTAL